MRTGHCLSPSLSDACQTGDLHVVLSKLVTCTDPTHDPRITPCVFIALNMYEVGEKIFPNFNWLIYKILNNLLHFMCPTQTKGQTKRQLGWRNETAKIISFLLECLVSVLGGNACFGSNTSYELYRYFTPACSQQQRSLISPYSSVHSPPTVRTLPTQQIIIRTLMESGGPPLIHSSRSSQLSSV